MSTRSGDRAQRAAKRPFDVNQQRRRDIGRLLVHRHGKLAKAALCIRYAEAAAWHCPSDSERRFLMVQWCRSTCAPPSIERQIDAILAANPARRMSADMLARHLDVSDAVRTFLRIWTIGAFDVPKAKRIKRRKEKRRRAAKGRRADRGGKPRERSYSRTKPWEAFGIKRRAWEYRGKPDPAIAQIRSRTHCANSRPRSSSLPSGYEFAQSAGVPPAPAGTADAEAKTLVDEVWSPSATTACPTNTADAEADRPVQEQEQIAELKEEIARLHEELAERSQEAATTKRSMQ